MADLTTNDFYSMDGQSAGSGFIDPRKELQALKNKIAASAVENVAIPNDQSLSPENIVNRLAMNVASQTPEVLAEQYNNSRENQIINNAIGTVDNNQSGLGNAEPIISISDGMFNPATGLRGNKAFRNNSPGNITGMGGKLLYGAKGFARSNTGDKGDQNLLFFNTPKEGWNAMNSLMSSKRYNNAPIKQAFDKYQTDKKAWGQMLDGMSKMGIDPNKQTFNSLSPDQKIAFMNQRARFEGFTGSPSTLETFGWN